MESDQKVLYFGLLLLIFLLVCIHSRNKLSEGFVNFNTYNRHTPNRNAFTNYYRIGSEGGKSLGWKPSMTWDHLRPENNECPTCFKTDEIFADYDEYFPENQIQIHSRA